MAFFFFSLLLSIVRNEAPNVFSFDVERRGDVLFDFGIWTVYFIPISFHFGWVKTLSSVYLLHISVFNIAIRMLIWLAGQLHGFRTPGPFTFICWCCFFFRSFPGNLSPMINGCSNVFHAAFITIFMWVWCATTNIPNILLRCNVSIYDQCSPHSFQLAFV